MIPRPLLLTALAVLFVSVSAELSAAPLLQSGTGGPGNTGKGTGGGDNPPITIGGGGTIKINEPEVGGPPDGDIFGGIGGGIPAPQPGNPKNGSGADDNPHATIGGGTPAPPPAGGAIGGLYLYDQCVFKFADGGEDVVVFLSELTAEGWEAEIREDILGPGGNVILSVHDMENRGPHGTERCSIGLNDGREIHPDGTLVDATLTLSDGCILLTNKVTGKPYLIAPPGSSITKTNMVTGTIIDTDDSFNYLARGHRLELSGMLHRAVPHLLDSNKVMMRRDGTILLEDGVLLLADGQVVLNADVEGPDDALTVHVGKDVILRPGGSMMTMTGSVFEVPSMLGDGFFHAQFDGQLYRQEPHVNALQLPTTPTLRNDGSIPLDGLVLLQPNGDRWLPGPTILMADGTLILWNGQQLFTPKGVVVMPSDLDED